MSHQLIQIILLACLLSGCSTYIVEEVPRAVLLPYPKECSFSGINSQLEKGVTHMVLIHGMGHYGKDWSKPIIEKLVVKLEAKLDPQAVTTTTLPSNSMVTSYELALNDGNRLYIHSIVYSHKLINYVNMYLEHNNDYLSKSSWLNRSLKKVMSGSIGYPFAYLGQIKSVRNELSGALNHIGSLLKDSEQVVVIAESLGASVIFDGLDNTNGGNGLAKKISHIYLYANQIPYFELAGTLYGSNKSLSSDEFKGLGYFLQNYPVMNGMNDRIVVAFNDPNDILSMPISPILAGRNKNTNFYNVITENAKPILNIFAEPAKAHTGYKNNDKVLEVVVNGSSCTKTQIDHFYFPQND